MFLAIFFHFFLGSGSAFGQTELDRGQCTLGHGLARVFWSSRGKRRSGSLRLWTASVVIVYCLLPGVVVENAQTLKQTSLSELYRIIR